MHAFAVLAITAFFGLHASACYTESQVTHTFYGWPDNDPPGNGIAHDCGRGYEAGGTGTYTDPLTFASAPGEFDWCEIIYDPYTEKYLRMEDSCAKCTTDWDDDGIWHIDVWTGSSSSGGGQKQIDCEDDLTPAEQSQTIVRNPATNLPVDTTALFEDGECNTDHVYSSYTIGDYC
ncbi:hypothetical protein BDV97DRAFT_379829 [Delphinella strobiligena]|nr:hypothetical protein BDV97DRAFT_379829 [Delphinella strobiligena]